MTRRDKLFCAASLLAVPSLAPAGAWAQPLIGPYISLGAGVNVPQDQIAPSSTAIINGKSVTEPKRTIFLDPGFSGQVSLGYGVGYGLRVELEGLYMNNHIRKVSNPSGPLRAGGVEQTYGGMGNVLYDLPLDLPITPYIGAGLGGVVGELDNYNSSSPGFVFPSGINNRQHVTDFAYQGIAGFSVPMPVPGLSLTAEYRFLGIADPRPAYSFTSYNANGSVAGVESRRFSNDLNHNFQLGLRYAFGAPVPPPPPPPIPVSAPAPQASRTYLVFFDWDRADLTARARTIISEAAQASTRVQLTRLAVNGYTDLSGTAAYNQKLSVRRAQAVAAELVRDGVPRSAISIQGFGEANPLVPTAQGVREPQNRRVEIILQ